MQIVDSILEQLDEQIQKKHLLTHLFYQAWSEGKLSKDCLKEYAIEYYHHVKAFPTYLSALHAHTEDAGTRKGILQNLIEEEAGIPNHPELWKSFALHLGATEEELDAHTPSAEIQTLIRDFRSICRDGSIAEGLAALYAYESQIPAVCVSKIEGLKKYYGMQDPAAWRYFSVHIAADEEHARMEKKLLAQHLTSDQPEAVFQAAQKILDGLWNFLSSLCHRHQIAC
jgi:pyrroloquinoline-quinone synthase